MGGVLVEAHTHCEPKVYNNALVHCVRVSNPWTTLHIFYSAVWHHLRYATLTYRIHAANFPVDYFMMWLPFIWYLSRDYQVVVTTVTVQILPEHIHLLVGIKWTHL